MTSATLLPQPLQPADVPWPSDRWPEAELPPGVDRDAVAAYLDRTFADPQPDETAQTNDLLVVHRGAIVVERYAEGVGPEDTQPSWSAAKSLLHAAVGILVRDGGLDIHTPAPVPEWQSPGDRRAAITIDQLLHMTPGLRFREDYVDDGVSDVIKMLFRPGADDMGAFAAAYPLDHEPDTVYNYSSGTTNIISAIVKRVVGGTEEAYRDFLRRELFDPIGMRGAEPRFDASGTWIGSSFCFCTPRDFARFGLLYLRDGVWDGRRILPERWVDHARTPAPVQPPDEAGRGYGAHWWLYHDDLGTFFAGGYAGQLIMAVPALDLVLVRNGNTPQEKTPRLRAIVHDLIELFRAA